MCKQLVALVVWLNTALAADVSAAAEPPSKETIHTDLYGDPLPQGAIMRIGTARFSQASAKCLFFSPDGRLLISAGVDTSIRIWDADTGKQLRALDGHKGGVYLISLSADGKWLASCDPYGELLIWEFDTGKIRQRTWRPSLANHGLSLSPNGKILATSGNTLRLWDTATGREDLTLPSSAEALAFSPDSKQLAYSAVFDHDISLLDVATGKDIRTFKGHKSRVYQLTFSPDGATLFSCSFDHTIRSWDVAGGKEKPRYGDEKETVGCFALAPDGKTLTFSTGFLVHIWDLKTNKDRMPPCKSKAWITPAIAYSPDSKKVAVGGEAIAIYNIATGKRLNPAPENESPIHQVKYARGGKVLLVWRRFDDTIELWDTAKWEKTQTLRPKMSYFTEMIVSLDGKYLTTGEGDNSQGKRRGIICNWDLQTGKRQREFSVEGGYWFDSLSYLADGKTLCYRQGDSHDQVFVFRDRATGEELRRLPALVRQRKLMPLHPESKPLLSPDGRVLVWGAVNNAVGLWDTKTGNLFRSFSAGRVGFHISPVVSPDGRTIATSGNQANIRQVPIQSEIMLWEMATGKERLHIAPNDGLVKRLAFSPDGRLLASVGQWETIHVWDMWTGKEAARFTGHRGPIKTFAFASDSKTLASGGLDNTVLIWNVSALAQATEPETEKLSREELAQCWENLAGADAARAYAAIAELIRHPNQAESLLQDKLASLKKPDTKPVARLIADLDSDDFKTRENASKELAILGQAAESALREKLEGNPSAELKRRIQELLDKLERKEDDPVQLRLLRAIEVLERLGTPKAKRLLRKLVEAAPDADAAREAQASLQRLGNAEAP